jgi:hypothetical protein
MPVLRLWGKQLATGFSGSGIVLGIDLNNPYLLQTDKISLSDLGVGMVQEFKAKVRKQLSVIGWIKKKAPAYRLRPFTKL